ncbi:hypothetical protein BUY54_12410, partial [Staphylococcus epidermidis]
MENLNLNSYIKRANKFMIFNIILSFIIAMNIFIISLNINDISDSPDLILINNVNNILKCYID